MTQLVTFGETMLRLSPPPGERLETADTLDFRTAGAESNVAITASRLEVDTIWLSKLPDTALGRRVQSDIRRHGVHTKITWTNEGRQGVYYIEKGKKPRGTNVIYDRTNAAITTARPENLSTEVIETADMFFTTGITPALSDILYETTMQIIETETTVGFDLNFRSKLWSESTAASAYEDILPSVDVLFAPERDVRSVLEIQGNTESIAETLQSRYDCEVVIITRGSKGVAANAGSKYIEKSALDSETIDPIGTGDAFVGAFLSQYIRDASIERALEFGTATAALKRTIQGDLAIVSSEEVNRIIEQRGDDISR